MAETQRRAFWWACCRCGDRMTQRPTEAEARTDRDAHIGHCPGRRAPWELRIATAIITDYA